MPESFEILSRPGKPSIAYARRPAETDGGEARWAGTPERPGVVFLPGFMSDMTGIKATFLEGLAGRHGLPYLRFDYSGHGASAGRFEDGTIGAWLGDVLDVLDALTQGPQVLVGSSMGGWLALLAALKRPDRVAGLIGLAAAPDFTEELIHSELDESQREALARDGVVYKETTYGDRPLAFTRALIEEGRNHLLLGDSIPIGCPIRLVHGYDDPDVPWEMALMILRRLAAEDVTVTYIKGGDHRLSRPDDLTRIGATVLEFARKAGPAA